MTIADAIDQGRPALVLFGTPAYCTSRFCGPEVTELQRLAADHPDRAVYIHVETWKDYHAQPQAINEGAADWLYRPNTQLGMTEPWLYPDRRRRGDRRPVGPALRPGPGVRRPRGAAADVRLTAAPDPRLRPALASGRGGEARPSARTLRRAGRRRRATRHGVRATGLARILAATALLQLAIVSLSGSVALLADTIHNSPTPSPRSCCRSRSGSAGDRRADATRTACTGPRTSRARIVPLILFSAVFAAAEAFERLLHPREPDRLGLVLAAGAIGFVGNEVVAIYRIRVGRRISGRPRWSPTGSTPGPTGYLPGGRPSAIATFAGLARADAVVGLAITAAIVWTSIGAARGVLHRILDGTDEETITLIEEVAAAVPGVEHVTEARARWTGHRLRAELSIDVDPATSVEEGHRIAERVRQALQAGVPRLDAAAVHTIRHEHDAHGA